MNGLLTAPGATRGILEKYGIHAKKKFGQNFLINAAIVDGIIEAAGITAEDCVLEIGPGIGTMSQRLSQEAGRLVCVEIDESLRPILNDTLEGYDNITILWQDILKTDIRRLVDEYNEGRPLKVVANLPYYVTTPILMKLLEMKGCFESITRQGPKITARSPWRSSITPNRKWFWTCRLTALCRALMWTAVSCIYRRIRSRRSAVTSSLCSL